MREQMRKLVAHMEWADARVLGAPRQAPSLRPVALELFGHALAVENAAGFRADGVLIGAVGGHRPSHAPS